jgi:hypothetical protein
MPSKNLLYIYTNAAEKHIVCHGVDFKGFLGALEKPLNNLLLIKHAYNGKNYNSQSGFLYVTASETDKLKAENISRYGDFCWVDFKDEFAPDQLTRLDIAELLYFGHKRRSFSSPVFARLQNRFAYWSHDDGWVSSIYFTDSGEMHAFISNAVSAVASTKDITGGKLPPETAKEMASLSENGLLIDGGELFDAGELFILPFYVTGKITNMDELVNNTTLYKMNAVKRGTLRFKKKSGENLMGFWRRLQNKKK